MKTIFQNAAPPEEEETVLLRQLQDARSQRAREQKKVTELGQQLASLLQENSALEEQLNVWRSKAQDVKSLQEEINALEEVRYRTVENLVTISLKALHPRSNRTTSTKIYSLRNIIEKPAPLSC